MPFFLSQNIRRPHIQIEEKLAIAEERRKAAEEEKLKTVLERSGLERHGRLRSASAYERQKQFSATLAKRQHQLQEIRDRLKDKHKKNDMIRLKKQLVAADSPTPLHRSLNSSQHLMASAAATATAGGGVLGNNAMAPAKDGIEVGGNGGFFDD